MSINISFHDQQLVEIKVIDNDLTAVNIYDNDRPFGSHVTFYFSNPTAVMHWGYMISEKAAEANKKKIESEDYERGVRVGYRVAQQEGVN